MSVLLCQNVDETSQGGKQGPWNLSTASATVTPSKIPFNAHLSY